MFSKFITQQFYTMSPIKQQDDFFKKKVLIVDDEASLAGMLNSVFFNFGLNTIVVVSGKDAISSLKHDLYDLVILDWQLQDITGKDVLDSMSAMPIQQLQMTPIVLHSKEKRESLNIPTSPTFDIIEYWQKPLTLPELCLAASDVVRAI